MSFDALIGQTPAKNYLRSVLESGRRSHAFLFKGPAGVGKRTAAYLFAQRVLCHHPVGPPGPDRFCAECRSCRWFAARSGAQLEHPDVIGLVKPDDGRLVGDHEPMISLDCVQYVCEQLHRSPQAGTHRAVIIPEAQRLCRGQAEAANAFLKTLEEPPAASLIILTSSQPEALLETIVSRVQAVTFKRLTLQEIQLGLSQKKSSAPQTETSVVGNLSDGSLGRAIELLEGDLKTWRALVIKELQQFSARSCPQFGLALWAAADSEGSRLFEAEEAAARQSKEAVEEQAAPADDDSEEAETKTETGWKRYVLRRMLELCEVCFRDGLISAAAGSQQSLLLQPDQPALADSLAKKFGESGCMKALSALRESLFAVRLYVRGDVVGRALAGRLVEALA
jgi:DNA polymerase III delta prime subunit